MNEAMVKDRERRGYTAFVRAARLDPALQPLVAANYLDSDLDSAIERFIASDEFQDTVRFLGLRGGERVLDFGAGRGIAAFAFAAAGCDSVALDMNSSEECGVTAVPRSRHFAITPVAAVQGDNERMPFLDATFDVVYCRHVLHHAYDLRAMVREVARVLKPAGLFLAVGEHTRPVIPRDSDFIETHPASAHGANEQLFSVPEYRAACRAAGLTAIQFVYPLNQDEFITYLQTIARRGFLRRLAFSLTRSPGIGKFAGQFLYWLWRARLDYFNLPGREVTFVARKRLGRPHN